MLGNWKRIKHEVRYRLSNFIKAISSSRCTLQICELCLLRYNTSNSFELAIYEQDSVRHFSKRAQQENELSRTKQTCLLKDKELTPSREPKRPLLNFLNVNWRDIAVARGLRLLGWSAWHITRLQKGGSSLLASWVRLWQPNHLCHLPGTGGISTQNDLFGFFMKSNSVWRQENFHPGI